ncbi:MFS transporter [Rhodobacteraceae bacterium PD-2]|nr:MFS transporter [Rhodobacteraceae bacterium PD-2]
MSKSLNLMLGVGAGVGLTLLGAYNFADRSVAGTPSTLRSMTALPASIPEPSAPVQRAQAAAKEPVVQAAAEAHADAPEGGLVAAAQADEATGTRFGIGRAALPEEIAAWDLDVSPDGTGLPEGSGDALTGEPLFEEACAVCHGSFAEGVDNWPKLAGGDGTLADEDPLKTVGSFWPYTSTVWDYVHRSMPFGNAQSLSVDDTYAIVAYILYSNDLIGDDFVLDQDTLPAFELPNAQGFVVDDRPEAEYGQWRAEPCMTDCKDSVEITMRATVLDVTPEESGEAPSSMTHSPDAATAAPVAEPEEQAEAAAAEPVQAADAAGQEAAAPAQEAALDMDLVETGERVFRKCQACHKTDGGKAAGPHLDGVFGREIGSVEGFKYSGTMAGMGGVWDAEALHAFLAKPRDYVKGTKMAFAGLRKQEELDAVTEYLKSISQ